MRRIVDHKDFHRASIVALNSRADRGIEAQEPGTALLDFQGTVNNGGITEMEATLEGKLDQGDVTWDARPAVCVVLAAGGYPGKTEKGVAIEGLTDAVMAPAVQVSAVDAFGNPAPTFTGTVTVAMLVNPQGAVLSGTLSRAAIAGVATFNDLQLSGVGTGLTLLATATGLASDTSAAFAITRRTLASK